MKFNKKVSLLLAAMFTAATLTACGEEEATTEETEVEAEAVEVPEYTIAEAGDLDTGNAVRPEYWIVPEDIMLDEDEIKLIADDVIEQAKSEQDFNAIVIWFLDDERQINNGYTIAKVEYAPEGDWSKAADVAAGDYDSHDYEYNFGSAMSGKLPRDYEEGEYPTEEELDIYFHWSDLVYEQGVEDEEAVSQTASDFDLSSDEVEDLIMKANLR